VISTSSLNLFMESYSFDLCVTPIHSVLPRSSLNGYFSIHLHYKHLTISHSSNDPTNPIFNSQTPIFDYFLIPHDILCNYNIHPVIDGYDHITHFFTTPLILCLMSLQTMFYVKWLIVVEE
jgi:hypothetical protein